MSTKARQVKGKLTDPPQDKRPPHSPEAEQAVLGCVLLDPVAGMPRLAGLDPDVFYVLAHRVVGEAMMGLHRTGKPVDVFNVQQVLQDAGRLEGVGGVAFISGLMDAKTVSTPGNLPTYLDTVLEKHARRVAIQKALDDAAAARDESKPFVVPATGGAGDEPWPSAVSGAELLDGLAGEYRRFISLPEHGDIILALWTLHTYSWEACEYSPILAITSPTRACGKSRVLDVLEKLACRPFRTGNMSEAVLFRVLHSRKPTVLVDELDSIPEERRGALSNILKHGFHTSGCVHRVEGEGTKEVMEFRVFGPKAVACIKLSTLDAATVSRTFNLRMQRKPTSRKVERLRCYDGTDWRRKCVRWSIDNLERIRGGTAVMPDELGDRQQDIMEPLFVLADLASGDWPERMRRASLALKDDGADAPADTPITVLSWCHTYFERTGTDRVQSSTLVSWLNEQAEAPFGTWNDGKGLNQVTLGRHLAGFDLSCDEGIVTGTIRLPGGKTAKGYLKEWFSEAFDAYLPKPGLERGHTDTSQCSQACARVLEGDTQSSRAPFEKGVSPNEIKGCDVVSPSHPEYRPVNAEMVL